MGWLISWVALPFILVAMYWTVIRVPLFVLGTIKELFFSGETFDEWLDRTQREAVSNGTFRGYGKKPQANSRAARTKEAWLLWIYGPESTW